MSLPGQRLLEVHDLVGAHCPPRPDKSVQDVLGLVVDVEHVAEGTVHSRQVRFQLVGCKLVEEQGLCLVFVKAADDVLEGHILHYIGGLLKVGTLF